MLQQVLGVPVQDVERLQGIVPGEAEPAEVFQVRALRMLEAPEGLHPEREDCAPLITEAAGADECAAACVQGIISTVGHRGAA